MTTALNGSPAGRVAIVTGGSRGVGQAAIRCLAARGYAVFAISYRLATKGKTFPQAVQDVLAGVQFVRGKAGEFGIDAARPARCRAARRSRPA